jgi:hypothetical protein
MQYHQFQMPETWTGCRDIDVEINLDEINQNLGLNQSSHSGES